MVFIVSAGALFFNAKNSHNRHGVNFCRHHRF
ncbi:MAG: hypothetical protein ACJAUZ_003243, partial [Flavobacteriaceae bacterium]